MNIDDLIEKASKGEELTKSEIERYQNFVNNCEDSQICVEVYAAVMKNANNMFAMHEAVKDKMVWAATYTTATARALHGHGACPHCCDVVDKKTGRAGFGSKKITCGNCGMTNKSAKWKAEFDKIPKAEEGKG